MWGLPNLEKNVGLLLYSAQAGKFSRRAIAIEFFIGRSELGGEHLRSFFP